MKCAGCNETLEPGSLIDFTYGKATPVVSSWHPGVPDSARWPQNNYRIVYKDRLVEVTAFRCPMCFVLTLRAAPPSDLPKSARAPSDTDALPRGTDTSDEG